MVVKNPEKENPEKENLKKELIEHNHIVSDLFFVLLISQISNPQYNIPKSFLLFKNESINVGISEVFF